MQECIFCIEPNDPSPSTLWRGKFCYIRKDNYPVTTGHCLIIPYAHVGSYLDLKPHERQEMDKALQHICNELKSNDGSITGFNMGINDGPSAGQTIPHCHIHVIPRRNGDMKDPRGGVRGVIPEKQKY